MADHRHLAMLGLFMAWDVARYFLRRRGDPDPARRARLLRHFTEEDIADGRAMAKERNRLFPLSRAHFYLYFGVLLFGGWGGQAEQRILHLVGDNWLLALPLFVLLMLLTWGLLHLSLYAHMEFVNQSPAGSTTPGRWLADQCKGLALLIVSPIRSTLKRGHHKNLNLSIKVPEWIILQTKSLVLGWVLASLLAVPIVALVRNVPAWWVLPASAIILPITAFIMFINPWLIAPLFYRFTPLDDEDLARKAFELTRRAGVTVDRILVTDESSRSSVLNANVAGLGSRRTVVLFDNLVKNCTPNEVLAAVGFTMGQSRSRHIAATFLIWSLGIVAGLFTLQLLLNSTHWRILFGLPEPHSLVLLVLVPFLASLVHTVNSPIASSVSRRCVKQADRVAIQLTGDPQALITLVEGMARAASMDLLTPRLLHSWYDMHPLPEDRIAAAEQWFVNPPSP